MQYQDFKLSLSRLPGNHPSVSYEVWTESPAGQARGKIEFSAAAFYQRVENLKLAALDSWKQLGSDLFHAVFQDDVLLCYAESLGRVGETDGLRIRIQTELPELVALPWELLRDARHERFLALSLQTPVMRSWRLPVPVKRLVTVPPLKVLIVTASPSDYVPLSQFQEESQVRSALVSLQRQLPVDVTVLSHATLAHLQETLRRGSFDILHFSGHAKAGALIFEDQHGKGVRVDAERLAVLLQDSIIRLAILNGCQTSVSSVSEGAVRSVAVSLMVAGFPAVVAMQQDIYDEAAIAFAHAFYAPLADGYPVEACVTEARKTLILDYGLHAAEWYTPVLFMRASDGYLFDLATEKESQIVSGLALGLSFKLDIRYKLEGEPEVQSHVRKGYKGIAGKIRRLLKGGEIGLEIKIERPFGAELELLSPCNTAVVAPPTFTWRLGADVAGACREVLKETGTQAPIEAIVSLHSVKGPIWRSPTQRVLPSLDLEVADLDNTPQSLACTEELFAGLDGGEAVYWWELSVSFPALDLEGTTRRRLYQRAYFRKLSEGETDLLHWLMSSLPLLSSGEDGMDEADWHILQGTVYESFDLYDEAIAAYQRAELLVSERSDPLGHLQRAFHKKAFAVLGSAGEGLLHRPTVRFAVEANTYRDRINAALQGE